MATIRLGDGYEVTRYEGGLSISPCLAAELEGEMRTAKAGKAAAEKIPGLRAELEALLNGTEARK